MLDDLDTEINPTETLQLTVVAEEAGMRIDRYITKHMPDQSRNYVRQLIDAGHVWLNGRSVRASTAVRVHDQVIVQRPALQPSHLLPQPIPLTVVYEDADIAVIDKPAGMVVHPAPGHPDGTLVNALLARYPDLQINDQIRPGIVHRLDQDTSGLLVIARTSQALRHLQEQQQAHTMVKAYLAVLEGPFHNVTGTIDAPIGRHPHDRLRMAVVADGRPARTHWRALEDLDGYTFVEARLETGRTHQIRVHFADRQRPVLGDTLYGPRRPRATFGLTRHFLHAYQLGFRLPSSEAPVIFESPLPPELAGALERLRARAGGGRLFAGPPSATQT